jgi:DNA-directed RNA polymerase specialized sigma24 family protein
MHSRLSAAELSTAADILVIALACAGDDAAFTEIVRRRHARVRSFMYRLCRRPALGDDLAQQVFVKVCARYLTCAKPPRSTAGSSGS